MILGTDGGGHIVSKGSRPGFLQLSSTKMDYDITVRTKNSQPFPGIITFSLFDTSGTVYYQAAESESLDDDARTGNYSGSRYLAFSNRIIPPGYQYRISIRHSPNPISYSEDILGNLNVAMSIIPNSSTTIPRPQRYIGKLKKCPGEGKYNFWSDFSNDYAYTRLDAYDSYYQFTNELYDDVTHKDKGLYTQVAGRDFTLKLVNFDSSGKPTPNQEKRRLVMSIDRGLSDGTTSLKEYILDGFDIVYGPGHPKEGQSIITNNPPLLDNNEDYRLPTYQINDKKTHAYIEFPVGAKEIKLVFKNFISPASRDNRVVKLMIESHQRKFGEKYNNFFDNYTSDSFSIRPSKLKVIARKKAGPTPPITAGTILGYDDASITDTTNPEAYMEFAQIFDELKVIPVGVDGKQTFGYRQDVTARFKINFKNAAHEAACKSHQVQRDRIRYLEERDIRVLFRQKYKTTERSEPHGVKRVSIVKPNIDIPSFDMAYYDPNKQNWDDEDIESMNSMLEKNQIWDRKAGVSTYSGLAFPEVGNYSIIINGVDKTYTLVDSKRNQTDEVASRRGKPDCRPQDPRSTVTDPKTGATLHNDDVDSEGKVGCFIPLDAEINIGDVVPKKIVVADVKINSNGGLLRDSVMLSNDKDMVATARFNMAALALNYSSYSYYNLQPYRQSDKTYDIPDGTTVFGINFPYSELKGAGPDSNLLFPYETDLSKIALKLFSKDCFAEEVVFDASAEEQMLRKDRDKNKESIAI